MDREDQIFFEKKFLQLYEPLYRFLFQLCKDAEAAEDLLQDTFSESLLHLPQLRKHPKADGWFYITARNKTMNYLRLRRHRDQQDVDAEGGADRYGTKASLVEDTVLEEYFQFAQLDKLLSREEIQLLRLRFDQGYEVRDIADRLQITEGCCKMRFSRIYRKLRSHPELFRLGIWLFLISAARGGW